jgi:hypothetical protein
LIESPNAEEEPSTVVNDWICGAKLVHLESKQYAKSKQPSILGTDRQNESLLPTKRAFATNGSSSKCLIRLSKEHHMERKRSLEVLRFGLPSEPGKF